MLINYIKIAFRNLLKNALFSAINILGLALSMSVCLIALIAIRDAFTYDKFHPHSERTFRIITDVTGKNGNSKRWATTPLPLAEKLQNEYLFVEKTVRVYDILSDNATYGSKEITIEGAFTDPSFFDIFNFELLYGDKNSALKSPYSVVLSQQTAELFFKKDNPVGKQIEFKNLKATFTITGVIKKTGNTHLRQKVYASFSTVASLEAQKKVDIATSSWKNYNGANCYVLLKKDVFEDKLKTALTSIAASTGKSSPNKNIAAIKYDIQRLDNITPGEELLNGGDTVSSMILLGIGGVTFLILLLACFNYTNLSLARSLTRAKEVGIRKVVGGSRLQLFFQLITESIVISFIAFVIAYVTLNLLLINVPVIREGMLNNAKPDPILFIIFFLFTIFTGILAGALPAWILSSFKPIQVIKNLSNVRIFKGLGIQKTLIVIQFAVSLIFIVFLVTIHQQTKLLSAFSYGFNDSGIMLIPSLEKNDQIFKEDLKKITGVEKVAETSSLFGFHQGEFVKVKKDKLEEEFGADNYYIDENLISAMGLTLFAGSAFSPATLPSEQSVILNEEAVKNLGFKNSNDAIHKTLYLNDTSTVMVAGVIKNFNYQNLRHRIGNLILRFNPDKSSHLLVKVHPQNSTAVVASVKAVFKKINPNEQFSFTWYDKQLNENRAKTDEFSIIAFLSFMAITIACIGLLGIATYTSKVRQKEIGIRKVLGARVSTILFLLSRDFLKLLLIAAITALPVAYLLSNAFLQEFAYRISVDWKILGVSVIFILLAGLITTSSQILKAALENPVKNLRTD